MSAESSQQNIHALAKEMGEAHANTSSFTNPFSEVLEQQIVAGVVQADLALFERYDLFSATWSTVEVDQVQDRRLAAASRFAIETIAGIYTEPVRSDLTQVETAYPEALSA